MSTRAPAPAGSARPSGFTRWHQRVFGFFLVVFAFELGLFLLVFPWLRNWDISWIPAHSPRLSDVWMSRYFRGALSGLGLLNIYVALAELVRQLKSMFGEVDKQ